MSESPRHGGAEGFRLSKRPDWVGAAESSTFQRRQGFKNAESSVCAELSGRRQVVGSGGHFPLVVSHQQAPDPQRRRSAFTFDRLCQKRGEYCGRRHRSVGTSRTTPAFSAYGPALLPLLGDRRRHADRHRDRSPIADAASRYAGRAEMCVRTNPRNEGGAALPAGAQASAAAAPRGRHQRLDAAMRPVTIRPAAPERGQTFSEPLRRRTVLHLEPRFA